MPDRLSPRRILALDDLKIEREIRDPIFGYIHVTKLENKIIDTEEFQRLDRIFQMPTARFVYPNACHTRKSHSLGVMHLTHKAFLRILYRHCSDIRNKISPLLFEPLVIEETPDSGLDRLDQHLGNDFWDNKTYVELIQCVRLAALLHDLGHAPFSHLFEDVCADLEQNDSSMKFNHEKMGLKILEEKMSSKLKSPFCCDDIKEILTANSQAPTFLNELIDGPYDCDKLDYLQRDSYHAGTREYGSVDFERVIDGFRVKDKLLISKSAIGALMNSFGAVQYMYTNLYYHKTSRIFDFMISDALKMMPGLIKELISDTRKFLQYDDFNFMTQIKKRRSRASGDDFRTAFKILKDVLDRRKSYVLILPYQITLQIARDKGTELERLKQDLEQMSGGLKVKVDFRAKIRPVGIDLEKLLEWLTHDNIFDKDDPASPTKNLEDVNKAYFRALTRYQILFYVFADRAQVESHQHDYLINRIKEEATQRLTEMERIEAM